MHSNRLQYPLEINLYISTNSSLYVGFNKVINKQNMGNVLTTVLSNKVAAIGIPLLGGMAWGFATKDEIKTWYAQTPI